MGASVSCRSLEGYQVLVHGSRHAWLSDEPESVGGDAMGPGPFELLLASLGACTVITVTMMASKAGMALGGIWVDLEGGKTSLKSGEKYAVKRTVKVRGELGDKDLKRVKAYADACPVHRILEAGAEIETEVVLV